MSIPPSPDEAHSPRQDPAAAPPSVSPPDAPAGPETATSDTAVGDAAPEPVASEAAPSPVAPGPVYPPGPSQGYPPAGQDYGASAYPPAGLGSAPGAYPAPDYGAAPGYTGAAYPTAAAYAPYPQPQPAGAQGVAVAALVLGIIALLICLLPIVGVVAGLVAVVLGIVAITRRQRKGFAVTGIVLGAVSLLVGVAATIGSFLFIANYDAIVDAGSEPSPTAVVGEEEPAEPETEPESEPTDGGVDLSAFAALDDAGLAAVLEDPAGHYGEQYVVYGEVQQYDHLTGPCQLYIWIDDEQQSSWEGYEAEAWAWAASSEEPDTECLEFEGIGQFSHLKLYVTVLGQSTIEFEDGAADLLSLDVQQVEHLTKLPQ